MEGTSTVATPAKSRFPNAVPFIIGNEAAERFSFYGMRSILTLFLVKQFFNPKGIDALSQQADAHANKLNHLFVMVAYALPFVGGMIADWFTGKYRLILYISMVYCLGHLLLSMFDNSLSGFEFGMLVVAIGAGGIKSCVSANVGDQFDASNQDLLSKVYGWFYFSINAGSMLATIAIPTIYKYYGPKWAFGVPGILMALATLIFFLGRKRYVKVPPQGINRNNLVFITFYALTHRSERKPGESLLDIAKSNYDPERV
jgi:POT family proton-dependent oligopeptide transporter